MVFERARKPHSFHIDPIELPLALVGGYLEIGRLERSKGRSTLATAVGFEPANECLPWEQWQADFEGKRYIFIMSCLLGSGKPSPIAGRLDGINSCNFE